MFSTAVEEVVDYCYEADEITKNVTKGWTTYISWLDNDIDGRVYALYLDYNFNVGLTDFTCNLVFYAYHDFDFSPPQKSLIATI